MAKLSRSGESRPEESMQSQGMTRRTAIRDAAKLAIGRSEWSGAVYSPDGNWVLVHVQYPGKSLAMTGPWERGWL